MSELFVFTLAQPATTTTVNIEIFKWLLFHESRSYLTIKKIRERVKLCTSNTCQK